MLLAPVQHHMTLMALSMEPFCLLGQDGFKQVQHDLFGYVMPVLA